MKFFDNQANIHALRRISSLFTTTDMDIDSLFGLAMDATAGTVDAVNLSLLLTDEKTGNLHFYQASGKRTKKSKNVEILSGSNVLPLAAD